MEMLQLSKRRSGGPRRGTGVGQGATGAMACFCRQTTATLLREGGLPAGPFPPGGEAAPPGLQARVDEQGPAWAGPGARQVAEAASWLAARWLPSPAPWRPDPAWLGIELPAPPMPPAASAVLLGLVQARLDCIASLGLDPAEPAAAAGLARVVATLDARLPSLQPLADDPRPWQALATLNADADAVLAAASGGALAPALAPARAPAGGPGAAQARAEAGAAMAELAPWRPLIGRVKALAPLLATARLLGLEPAQPSFGPVLAAQVRALRTLALPPLADPTLLLRVTAQLAAVARLKASFGADPRLRPFAGVQAAVRRKVAAAAALLPAPFAPPPCPPNPSSLVNAQVMALLGALTPERLSGLAWQVPARDGLALLTTVAPVAALAAQVALLGTGAVRAAPCGQDCDAARVARAATASAGTGTRAGQEG